MVEEVKLVVPDTLEEERVSGLNCFPKYLGLGVIFCNLVSCVFRFLSFAYFATSHRSDKPRSAASSALQSQRFIRGHAAEYVR